MQSLMLDNGLTVQFTDQSRRYFGNFYHVRITVRCSFPLTPGLAGDGVDFDRLFTLLGGEVEHVRTLEQMGVCGDDLEPVRQRLRDNFMETSAPYLASPSFPRQLLASRVAQLRRQGRLRS